MKGRYQGRALSACSQVACSEFSDHIHAREFGQKGWVVELQGVTYCALAGAEVCVKFKWAMAHSLTMRADGLNCIGLHSAFIQQGLNHFGISSC